MKRVHATRAIVLLIIVVLIWQYVEKRNDLQCYVMQLATRHEYVFKTGYASEDEIRAIVWNDTLADFHGGAWRASLDQIFHAIFMGGNRGQLVLTQLKNPPADSPDLYCSGSITWEVWYDPDSAVHRSYSATNLKSVHHVTTALKAIPQEELRHYSVEVDIISWRGIFDEHSYTLIAQYRDDGEVSAREWLGGKILPDYWSGWYYSWLERWKELPHVDNG